MKSYLKFGSVIFFPSLYLYLQKKQNVFSKELNLDKVNLEKNLIYNNYLIKDNLVKNVSKINYNNAKYECEKLIEQLRILSRAPGVVVGVSHLGKEVWSIGQGFADVETKAYCTSDTIMRIASISKPITMLLVGKLLEEKKLDLDKSIYEYLGDKFPKKYYNNQVVDITLRQLVSHLSGIRHYNTKGNTNDSDSEEFYLNKEYSSVIESLDVFKNDDLVHKPGTKFHYSTYGFTLISAVIQSVLDENKNFENELLKLCQDKIGMKSTYLDKYNEIIPGRSKYYYLLDNKLYNVSQVNNSYKWAGGGLLSNVHDLLKFGNVMLYSYKTNDGFLKQETVNNFWTPIISYNSIKNVKYGMGWAVKKEMTPEFQSVVPEFKEMIYHTGAAVGSTSLLLILPEEELIVCMIANLESCKFLIDYGKKIAEKFSKDIKNQIEI